MFHACLRRSDSMADLPTSSSLVLTEKKRISVSISNSIDFTLLNPTQSVVIRLIEYLSIYINKGLSFYLFLDNLFVYWKSAIALKECGIAVTGTVRKGASGYPPIFYSLSYGRCSASQSTPPAHFVLYGPVADWVRSRLYGGPLATTSCYCQVGP
jgi:hypothetical protein